MSSSNETSFFGAVEKIPGIPTACGEAQVALPRSQPGRPPCHGHRHRGIYPATCLLVRGYWLKTDLRLGAAGHYCLCLSESGRPMAKSAADCAHMLTAMAGPTPETPRRRTAQSRIFSGTYR